ncbi:tubby [Nematocida sp. AWRm80]|nr:tubby [Nematocida sp. AWRm80]
MQSIDEIFTKPIETEMLFEEEIATETPAERHSLGNSPVSAMDLFVEPESIRSTTIYRHPGIEEMARGKIVKKKGCFFDNVQYLENEHTPVLTAKRTGLSWTITGQNKERVAVLKSNLLGTEYRLKREGDSQETIYIKYTGLYSEGGPRSFEVFINPKDKKYHESLSQRVKEKTNKYIQLVNKQPYYNSETSSYILNFNGRVTLPSVRNFQIIHPNDSAYITMTFGKIAEGEYVLDYSYPWCALDAFGVGLSALGLKIGCE